VNRPHDIMRMFHRAPNHSMKAVLGFLIILGVLPALAADTNSSSGYSKLDVLVAEKGSPLIYDKDVGEYQLVWTNQQGAATIVHRWTMQFDPFTGKELGSRRGELFAKPSPVELREVHRKLRECKTIEDVIKQFGRPDQVWPKGEDNPHTRYDFEQPFKTLTLSVQVLDDGSLQPMTAPKQIKKSVNE
jgi:hypothetical protein